MHLKTDELALLGTLLQNALVCDTGLQKRFLDSCGKVLAKKSISCWMQCFNTRNLLFLLFIVLRKLLDLIQRGKILLRVLENDFYFFFNTSKTDTMLFLLYPLFCLLISELISVSLKSLRFLILKKIRAGARLSSVSITLQGCCWWDRPLKLYILISDVMDVSLKPSGLICHLDRADGEISPWWRPPRGCFLYCPFLSGSSSIHSELQSGLP